jgi:hypothetical protein
MKRKRCVFIVIARIHRSAQKYKGLLKNKSEGLEAQEISAGRK